MCRSKLKCVLVSLALVTIAMAKVIQAQDTLTNGQDWIKIIEPEITNINTDELIDLVSRNSKIELIDVRTANEIAHAGGMIRAGRRTHNVNRGWLEFQMQDRVPDLTTTLVVYCGTNQRSPLAAATLQKMGYSKVYNYADGFPAWVEARQSVRSSDELVGSMLYRKPIQVQQGVWSAIGATAPATYENSGHNNNLSFVVGAESVLVVNAGDNYLLAKSLHDEIRQITDLPVRYVVLENGQGHAMLGMNYWQQNGAKVIAQVDTAAVIEERGEAVLQRMRTRNRDKSMGTELSQPDITFDDSYQIDLGGLAVEVLRLGPSHSRGDTQVWLPEMKLMIAGDMAFHERLLPVFDDSDTGGWIETWKSVEALQPEVIVPGHGHPTTMDVVKKWTIDYLQYMRSEIGEILDNGGSLIDAYKIDQSAYSHLDTFDELSGLNADRIYRAMEFE